MFFALQGIPTVAFILNINAMVFEYSRIVYCIITVVELIFIVIILSLINELLKITKIKRLL